MKNILITGGNQADRLNYVTELALKYLCTARVTPCKLCNNCRRVLSKTHPNVVFIEPIKSFAKNSTDFEAAGLIKIDQIRPIVIENEKTNFENGIGIFVITHMHNTTTSAANALLKVIEESKPNKLFLALAPSKMAVLPTIASRLLNHSVKPTDLALNDDKRGQIKSITMLPHHERFLSCAQFSTERDDLISELDEISYTCHLMLRNKELAPNVALKLMEALNDAQENLRKNLNPRLTTEYLVLREWPFTRA